MTIIDFHKTVIPTFSPLHGGANKMIKKMKTSITLHCTQYFTILHLVYTFFLLLFY